MTSKHWALVGGAVACLSVITVKAAPWTTVGDAYERHQLQKRADSGSLSHTVTTWPVMKGSVGMARNNGLSAGLAISGSTENEFITDYDSAASQEGMLAA